MSAILLQILKSIGVSLLAKPMLFWGARLAARNTDTPFDDELINLVEAGYDGDTEKMQAAIKEIGLSVEEYVQSKKK